MAPLVYLEGVKAGADRIHTSIAPLANGAAQPSMQSMAKNLRALGYRVEVDDDLVAKVGEHFRRIAEQENKPVGQVLEYDAFHYEHQIPGGMLSNFRAQLAELGLSHKFQELLEECARVRNELGYPIMITPFAQFVGIQAVLNVVHRRALSDTCRTKSRSMRSAITASCSRRSIRTCSTASSPTARPDRAETGAAGAGAGEIAPTISQCQRRRARARIMFAGTQVDEMLAAGPMRTEYVFEKPLVRLVRELASRKIARVHFSAAANG